MRHLQCPVITFRKTAADTNGEYLEIDLELAPDGHVPGKHVHPRQEERFEVLSGTMKFRMGLKTVVAGTGEVVVHLVPTQASRLLSAFSSGQSYSLSVDVLSGRTGRRLSTFDVPGSSVDGGIVHRARTGRVERLPLGETDVLRADPRDLLRAQLRFQTERREMPHQHLQRQPAGAIPRPRPAAPRARNRAAGAKDEDAGRLGHILRP